MSALEELISQIESGNVIGDDGEALSFEGGLFTDLTSFADLEAKIGYEVPEEIKNFIHHFGGMKLYVDENGLGFRLLQTNEIEPHNLNQQKTTDIFWPTFLIFGYSSSDDMLVLYSDCGSPKFGILDHEAWGEPDLWVNEAVSWLDFTQWLDGFVMSKGDV